MKIWHFWFSDCMSCIRLSICYWLFKCRVLRVMCVWEGRQGQQPRFVCKPYELHHCVCHTTLFRSRLELMVKLRTLLTFFTLVLKAEAHNYGKGVTFWYGLWCSANPGVSKLRPAGPAARDRSCGDRKRFKNNTNLALNMEK